MPQLVPAGPVSTIHNSNNTHIFYCKGETVFLQAPTGRTNYVWNNGTAGSSLTVTQKGRYWVKSEHACDVYIDTFTVSETNLAFGLGPDTSICNGVAFKLEPSPKINQVSFLWQDNSIKSQYIVKEQGKYYLTISRGNCTASDTVNIYLRQPATFSLGNDTIICEGTFHRLTAPTNLQSYKWSTDDTTSSITVSNTGVYTLETVDDKGCTYTDTILVTTITPSVTIGNDTTICKRRTLTLSVNSMDGSNYMWSNNTISSGNIATVSDSGKYWITVKNKCGAFSDSINVYTEECDCEPFMPSAFTPNNDGLNDNVKPLFRCPVEKYKIIIANRWGQVVFRSTDPNARWDGRAMGAVADIGTFIIIYR